jgi:hypothetical protein
MAGICTQQSIYRCDDSSPSYSQLQHIVAVGCESWLLCGLLAHCRSVFQAFVEAVPRDSSKAQMLDGTVHPTLASSLSFLRRLLAYGPVVQVVCV